MFDSLTGRLQDAFRNLRGMGRISDSNVAESLREVRMALLEADVNFKVAREFIESVRDKAIGERVFRSIRPGEQMVKIIHDRMVALLGSSHEELHITRRPSSIMMVGLHGSGKTTSSGKLARLLLRENRKPFLVAADVHRPAAMDQLEALGEQIRVPVHAARGETDVLRIARAARKEADARGCDVLIYDTAGRLQIDEPLVRELVRLRELVEPQEVLLVLDAATGQEAVNVATHFDRALSITGCILTKLDGDARGGAALSMKSVTGKPVKLVGTGERIDEFERFHPDRMAGRILGMGDVVSLVERVSADVDQEEMEAMERKMRKGEFTLTDFLSQIRQLRKLGSMESLIRMIPGGGQMLASGGMNDNQQRQFVRMEALICSMTPQERNTPRILDASRRQRISAGSGVPVIELNRMLGMFDQMRRMMKKVGRNPKMLKRAMKRIPRRARMRRR